MGWYDDQVKARLILRNVIVSGAVFVKTNSQALQEELRNDKRDYQMFTLVRATVATYVAVPDTPNDRLRFHILYSTYGDWNFEKENVLKLVALELRYLQTFLGD